MIGDPGILVAYSKIQKMKNLLFSFSKSFSRLGRTNNDHQPYPQLHVHPDILPPPPPLSFPSLSKKTLHFAPLSGFRTPTPPCPRCVYCFFKTKVAGSHSCGPQRHFSTQVFFDHCGASRRKRGGGGKKVNQKAKEKKKRGL